MDPREEFAKQFIQAGQSKGASKEEVAVKLDQALKEYDALNKPKVENKGILGSLGEFLLPSSSQEISRIKSGNLPGQPSYISPTGTKGNIIESTKAALSTVPDFVGRALSPAAEITSYIPGPTGAISGGLYGASLPTDNAVDRVKNAVVGAATGAIAGKAGNLAAKKIPQVIEKVAEKVVGPASQYIRKIIRPVASEVADFAKKTGLKFEEEIVKRDGEKIVGMGYPELINYFESRAQEANAAVDSLLSKAKGFYDKTNIEKKISTLVESLNPSKGNVGTGNAINGLNNVLEDLVANPAKLTWTQVQNIKRQLGNLASAAYDSNGNPSLATKKIADVERFLAEEIEKKFPSVKELNKTTQLYHLVNNGIRKTAEQEANKITTSPIDKVLQQIPALSGIGAGLITGNPFIAAGALAGTSGVSMAREALRSPEIATKLAGFAKNISTELPSKLRVPDRFSALRRALGNVGEKATIRTILPNNQSP